MKDRNINQLVQCGFGILYLLYNYFTSCSPPLSNIAQPDVCVFFSACAFLRFIAFITTGMVAKTLTPARTHAIISMIFSSWHSVNPPLIWPTPWLQTITPHMLRISTPDTIQRMVEMTKNTVWNIEWKYFRAQWNPQYTADRKIVRAEENIRKASRARSVFE